MLVSILHNKINIPPHRPYHALLSLRLNAKKRTHLLHAARIHLLQHLDPPALSLLLALLVLLAALLLLALRQLVLVALELPLAADVVADAAERGGFGFERCERRQVRG